jgi:hypothetical protein
MWIRQIRIRNTDSHLEKWGGGHCQLGEAVQEVVGEAERGQAAQKHVDQDPDPDPQTLILTWRSAEEDTASWARLSRRLWERLSEVRWPKNMWILWIRIRIRNTDSHLEKRGGGDCQLGEAVQEVV